MIAPNGIAAVPDHVTQTLAWIEDQIAQLSTARSALMRSFSISEPDQGNGPGPGPTESESPRPAQPRRKGTHPDAKHRVADKSLLAIARELLTHGPMKSTQIVAATGLSRMTIAVALRSSTWFEKLPGNIRSPWQLTEAGKAAASEEPSK